jgi:mxaJ protein
VGAATIALAQPNELRVCADSNNLPFSNKQRQGFENKLAEMVARDLGRHLEFVWWPHSPMRAARIFRAGICDLVMAVPTSDHMATTTRFYYRSSYVFVTRADRNLVLRSFDDPKLRNLRIGLPVVADGFTPAERELAQRGMIRNVVGYSVFGDFSKPNPPADLIRAVARGTIDVAVAWGPLAGYFAKNSAVPLRVTPICPSSEPVAPLTFSISMGVQPGDTAFAKRLDSEIARRHNEIGNLLRSYGVPVVDAASEARSCQ